MPNMTPPRRGRRRSPEAEQAILDQAMLILLQHGLQGFTLDKVAAAASVSKATIYRRWRSREEVVLAALGTIPPIRAEIKDNVIESLNGIIQQFVSLVKSSPEQLDYQTRMVTMLPSLLSQCANHPALMEGLQSYIEQRKAPMREVLNHSMATGEIGPLQDLDLLIDAIMGPIVLRLFLGGGDVSEQATRELISLTFNGINSQHPDHSA